MNPQESLFHSFVQVGDRKLGKKLSTEIEKAINRPDIVVQEWSEPARMIWIWNVPQSMTGEISNLVNGILGRAAPPQTSQFGEVPQEGRTDPPLD